MSDTGVYRISGVCALAAIAITALEYPLYTARGTFPGLSDSARMVEFTARNAHNMYTCLLMDLVIVTLITVFLAGFRHMIRVASPRHEWLATAFFAIGIVYIALTLVADSLQAASAVDAQSIPPDPTIIRAITESMLLMYGEAALFLMGVFMALGSWLARAARVLPAWAAWVGYVCAAGCFVFLPSVYVGRPDIMGFYNPVGWGSTALASGLPLAVWMVTTGILMLRMRGAGEMTSAGAREKSGETFAMRS